MDIYDQIEDLEGYSDRISSFVGGLDGNDEDLEFLKNKTNSRTHYLNKQKEIYQFRSDEERKAFFYYLNNARNSGLKDLTAPKVKYFRREEDTSPYRKASDKITQILEENIPRYSKKEHDAWFKSIVGNLVNYLCLKYDITKKEAHTKAETLTKFRPEKVL